MAGSPRRGPSEITTGLIYCVCPSGQKSGRRCARGPSLRGEVYNPGMKALLCLLLSVPGRAAEPRAQIVPEQRGPECHQMAGPCPAGWHVKEAKTGGSGDAWVECCQDAGDFKALPPQPPEKFPICNPQSRSAWLAVGIEFEKGCDLRYSTCAIVYRPEPDASSAPEAAPVARPAAARARAIPAKPLPSVKVVSTERGRREASGALAGLLEGLKVADPQGRERAALALAAQGPKAASALAELKRLLKADPSPRVRACAIVGVAGVAPSRDDAVSAIKAALSDSDPKVRAVAAQALKVLTGR